jgi:hypothetical protein
MVQISGVLCSVWIGEKEIVSMPLSMFFKYNNLILIFRLASFAGN